MNGVRIRATICLLAFFLLLEYFLIFCPLNSTQADFIFFFFLVIRVTVYVFEDPAKCRKKFKDFVGRFTELAGLQCGLGRGKPLDILCRESGHSQGNSGCPERAEEYFRFEDGYMRVKNFYDSFEWGTVRQNKQSGFWGLDY